MGWSESNRRFHVSALREALLVEDEAGLRAAVYAAGLAPNNGSMVGLSGPPLRWSVASFVALCERVDGDIWSPRGAFSWAIRNRRREDLDAILGKAVR